MFNDCSSITHITINIRDNIKNISYMFNGCSKLTDISGTRFGAGITTTTEWISTSQILYANNISLNSQNIKFKNFNNLIQCNNLVINPSFTNLNELFYGCSSITNIDLSNNSLPNCRGVARLCESCTSLISLKLPEFNDKVDIYRLCAGCGKVEVIEFYPKIMDVSRQYGFEDVNYQVFSNCSRLTTLKNFKVKCTLLDSDREKYLLRQSIGGLRSMWSGTNNLRNTEGMGVYNNDGRAIFYGYLGDISEFEIGSEVTDISYIFQGRKGITKDFEFTNRITNCTEAFKGCTSITHIHSNWKKTYNGDITATDCYNGCTEITHVDDIDIGKSEYKNGLDDVPTSWGGYGFGSDVTGIYIFEIPEDNYTLTIEQWGNGLIGEKKVVWGDGTSSTGELSHVYATAGTYIVKMHGYPGNPTNYSHGSVNSTLVEVVKIPYRTQNLSNIFCDCSKLVKANISNAKGQLNYLFNGSTIKEITANNLVLTGACGIFNGCGQLKKIIGMDTWDTSGVTSFGSMFYVCVQLEEIDLSNFDTSNCTDMSWMFRCHNGGNLKTIKGLENFNTSKVTKMNNMFEGQKYLTTLNVGEWDVSKVIDMQQMFGGCEKLVSVDFLTNWNINNVKSISGMFNGCKKITEVNFNPDTYMANYGASLGNTFNECHELTRVTGLKLNPNAIYNNQNTLIGFIARSPKIRYIENMYLGGSNSNAYNIFAYSDRGAIPDNSVTFVWDSNSIFKGFDTSIKSGINIGYESLLRICTPESRQSFAENVYDRASNGLDTITLSRVGSAYLNEEQIALITNKGYTLVN